MIARAMILLASCLACGRLEAGSLNVTVQNAQGAPVSDAVVYATSPTTPARAGKQVVLDQQDKQFVPYVTAVEVGTSVIFPNKDNIRHHVYSLSPAKKFELPLYAGTPAKPVVFENEGFVTLGCNIHDWMIGYLAVVATPSFKVSGANGRVTLADLPPGNYTVSVWHPLLKGAPKDLAQSVQVGSDTKELHFSLSLKPEFRAKRAPGVSNGGYP